MHVLVADDDAATRLVLQRALTQLGHTCVVAADGEEAWQALQERVADVLITDWMMPRLQGPDLCRRVRAASGAPYVYVIMLTSRQDRESALEGMQSGVDDFLVKPLRVDELRLRLIAAERICGLHRALAEREAQRVTTSRLEGVLLAAHTLEHELSNKLALTVGYAEMVAQDPELPERLREMALKASQGGTAAAHILDQLLRTTHVEETPWGPRVGTTIDLDRSVA